MSTAAKPSKRSHRALHSDDVMGRMLQLVDPRRIGSQRESPPLNWDVVDGDPYWLRSGGYEDARRSVKPCEFDEPVGVAFRDKRLYVSERSGHRIQIISIPKISRGPIECLQIIPSPYGLPLAGLCLSGNRLCCMGRRRLREGEATTWENEREYSFHLFAPIVL